MIAIICALPEERDAFLKFIKNSKKLRFDKFKYHGTTFDNVYYKGKIGTKNVVIMHSGVGKVYSSILTTLCIKKFKPELIINVGAAGSLDKNVFVGDTVIATRTAYWDVDYPGWDRSINSVKMSFGCDKKFIKKFDSLKNNGTYKKGYIVSGDQFIYNKDQVKIINKYFKDALCCEMEGASIANTCYAFDVPVAIVRSISDSTFVKNNINNFDFNLNETSDIAAKLCVDIIRRY